MKNLLKNYFLKMASFILIFLSLNTYAQYGVDWERNYGGTNYDYALDVITTSDGGYVMVGNARSEDIDVVNTLPPNVNDGLWIVKLNSSGTILWQTSINHCAASAGLGFPIDILETIDGGFIFGSTCSSGTSTNSSANLGLSDILITKLNGNGLIQWEEVYGGTGFETFNSLIQLDNGNLIVFGESESSDIDVSANYGMNDLWVLELTSTGSVVWEKNYGGSQQEWASNLIKVSDGYVFSGSVNSTDVDFANVQAVGGGTELFVMKIDLTGTLIWTKKYGGNGVDKVNRIISTIDEGFVFVGKSTSITGTFNANYGNEDAFIVKIDSIGDVDWVRNYGGIHDDEAIDVVQKSNGNIVVGGDTESNSTTSNVFGSSGYLVVEIDQSGNTLLERRIGGTSFLDDFCSLLLDDMDVVHLFATAWSSDGDIANNYGNSDIWFAKLLDLLANINGNVILDNNSDCNNTIGDLPLSNILLTATNGVTTFYGFTSSAGEYAISTDTTNYDVSLILPSPYLDINACTPDTQTAVLNSVILVDTIDFYIDANTICPYMEVDISAPVLRRCFASTYFVSYCNNGTQIANNAYLEIAIDPALVVNGSSIPWTAVSGNLYTFPIGNVDAFECDGFSIDVFVPCDSSVFLGQVLCTEAHIYPDSLCLPTSSTWNGAELEATAECLGEDSVIFSLKNIGTGNMTGDVPIIGIEDVILVMDTDGVLNVGEVITWKFPSNGISTHRILAQQPLDHPVRTFTTDAIANCNFTASVGPPPATDSAFLAYPNDEEADYIAIDCQEIIGSYDPNDKTVYPSGVSANHYITSSTDLEYKIRFQNTGTDTAFTVVIRDSISSLLDLTDFSAGASSHAYTYTVSGTGVLTFTFNNILLPDSFVDEQASHGFVQYKIAQKASNGVGDIILNNADIFFDFNEPIRTNNAFNEIGGIFLDTLIYKFPIAEEPNGVNEFVGAEIKVYPNPSERIINFQLEEVQKDVSIELFDITGKIQQKTFSTNTNIISIDRGSLKSGIYVFKIYTGVNEIAFGKVVFN